MFLNNTEYLIDANLYVKALIFPISTSVNILNKNMSLLTNTFRLFWLVYRWCHHLLDEILQKYPTGQIWVELYESFLGFYWAAMFWVWRDARHGHTVSQDKPEAQGPRFDMDLKKYFTISNVLCNNFISIPMRYTLSTKFIWVWFLHFVVCIVGTVCFGTESHKLSTLEWELT